MLLVHRPARTFALPVTVSAIVLGVVVVGAGCEAPPPEPAVCVSTEKVFQDEVWGSFMGTNCYGCHNAQGQASASELVLRSSNEPGFLSRNFDIVKDVASYERDGVSILLLKPSAQIAHGGGEVIAKDGPEYQALERLIGQFKSPVQCLDDGNDAVLQKLDTLDELATFRKATLVIGGRVPTDDEIAQLDDGDAADLDAALDGLLEEEGFERFLKEAYGDLLLTDRYNRDSRALDLLDGETFPSLYWYDQAGLNDNQRGVARRLSNSGVAREPLELIAWVAKSNLPWTEILLADYMMVNANSAKSYGITDVEFKDPDGFVPARLPGYPHAGVLTSPMVLNRFPTTETNRNRHRARMVYQLFLATDVMKLADRPVEASAIADFNPTLYNPQCTVCHANIDPVAGALQAWNERGRLEPRADGWYQDMAPPGYGAAAMPFERANDGARWLAEQIAQDPLFALSTVHVVYKALTGRAPEQAPSDTTHPDYAALLRAYELQNKEFERVATAFTNANFNIKAAVKAVIAGPYFRASDILGEPTPEEMTTLASFGTARFLTPELLDRKITAVLGVPWVRGFDRRSYLTTTDEYLIFFGGIDSDAVIQRITQPNGVMAAVATRMASDMACASTARDFHRSPSERLLFPYVDANFTPEDINGFEVAQGKAAILKNIQHLHERILGEHLADDDEEIVATYNLWLDTWRRGQTALATDAESRDLAGACRVENDPVTREPLPENERLRSDPLYTMRAWQAVVFYLLSDARFLHD